MFDLEKSIAEWRRQMRAAGIKTPAALNELENHLRDNLDQLAQSGVTAQEAYLIAVGRIGQPATLCDEFAKAGSAKESILRRSSGLMLTLNAAEKSRVYRAFAVSAVLSLASVAFSYFVLFRGVRATADLYSDWLGFQASHWPAVDYIGFVRRFMLVTALGFQPPIVLLTLLKTGILDYTKLKSLRPYMIVINLILGVLTNPQVITQILVAAPLQMFFEIAVVIAGYWDRQKDKKDVVGGSL